MKTWLSYLLPDDEYKERRLLYFISEGAILQMVSIVTMLLLGKWVAFFEAGTILLISSVLFIFYVSARYIFSGIEYTDIATEHAYKQERKAIVIKTAGFVIISGFLYLLVDLFEISEGFSGENKWVELMGLLVSLSVVMFLANYISLKRSYQKNKDLL